MKPYDEEVRMVRRGDNGQHTVTDVYYLDASFGGSLPAIGTNMTLIFNDGWYYTIEIIECHQVIEPERQEHYWCLIFKDVDNSAQNRSLARCLNKFSRAAEKARSKKARAARKAVSKPPS